MFKILKHYLCICNCRLRYQHNNTLSKILSTYNIDTIPENTEIFFFFFCQYRTPLVLTQNDLHQSLCHFQCREPQAVVFFPFFFFWLVEVMNGRQCWGKLLLKVMHYNITLLPKKVTNYVTWLLFMESNALRYFCVTF